MSSTSHVQMLQWLHVKQQQQEEPVYVCDEQRTSDRRIFDQLDQPKTVPSEADRLT